MREKGSLKEYRTLFPYISKYVSRYLLGFLFLVTVDIVQLLIPQCIRRAVDLISSGTFSRREIFSLSGAIAAIALALTAGRFLWRYFIHGASRRIETELRDKLFGHLLTLSYDFYGKNKIGDLMARATNDLNTVRMSIGFGLVAFIDGTVMALAILVIMFLDDAGTAGLAVLPLLPITLLILLLGKMIGKRFRRAQETYSAMSDAVQETFAGIRVVKSFVKENWFIKKFADTNEDYKAANMVLVKIFGVFFPLITFLSGVTTLILLLAGGKKVIEGTMSAGSWVAMMTYLQMLIWPLMGAGFTVNMIQRGAAGLARVNEILAAEPGIKPPEHPRTAPRFLSAGTPAILFRNFSFSYIPDRPVLCGINLSINSGDVVGILGKTGSGKTTLLKSAVRLVDPPPGTVFVNGLDVRDWDIAALRRSFGMTPQDTYLFSDSIKNNIAYGLSSADDEARIRHAAEISSISRDLDSFAQGWDTLVGERGMTLSGGQKQRVALSRALLMEPEMLALDDAFSAVDTETERRILTSLLAGRKGKTTIIVSHRVSTLRHADLVLVLESGRITEAGKPRDLARRGGFYAAMARLQSLEAVMEKEAGDVV